jgi:hypothetical protein
MTSTVTQHIRIMIELTPGLGLRPELAFITVPL